MSKESKPRTRSPNAPIISLKAALGLMGKIYDHAQLHPLPVETVVNKLWGLSLKSARSKQLIASLRAFGLIATEGTGDKRKIRVSAEGAKIHDGHTEHDKLTQLAAVRPALHKELWAKYSADGLPPDETIRGYLLHERDTEFSKGAVDHFIRQFQETISFAKLDSSAIINQEDEVDPPSVPKVGDFVQWESGGALKFEAPRRVSWISDDGKHLLVDGSTTGLPVEEIKVVTAPAPPAPGTENPPFVPPAGREVFTITLPAEGLVTVQTPGKIGKDSMAMLKTWLDACLSKVGPDST